MKANKRTIILVARAAEFGKLRSILRDWGYEHNEINRVLDERYVTSELDESDERSTQLTHVPPDDRANPRRTQLGEAR